jgi:NTP pyrophosphatase (non-canonical NTP hydrolase)
MTDAIVFQQYGNKLNISSTGTISVDKVTFTQPLSFDAYQAGAATTVVYPESAKVTYPVLGLASEAGEVAGKLKKVIRDKGGILTEDDKAALAAELGDILWYLAAIAIDLDIKLSDMAQGNLDKLASRKARNVLGGSGDNR